MAERPKWAEECPVAYAHYIEAMQELEKIVPVAAIAVARVMMAYAWTAGQDSVTEKARTRRETGADMFDDHPLEI